MKNKKLVQLSKIELSLMEKITITTALKNEAKRTAEIVKETKNKHFAEKLQRQKDLYKRFTGWNMDLPVLLDEL